MQKKFVGTDKVIKENSGELDHHECKVSFTYGIPDEDNKYLMQLKPGAVTYICVDDNGMLLSINRKRRGAACRAGNPGESGSCEHP